MSILSQSPTLPLWVTKDVLPRYLRNSAEAAVVDEAAAAELRESTSKMRAEIQTLRCVCVVVWCGVYTAPFSFSVCCVCWRFFKEGMRVHFPRIWLCIQYTSIYILFFILFLGLDEGSLV